MSLLGNKRLLWNEVKWMDMDFESEREGETDRHREMRLNRKGKKNRRMFFFWE